MNVANVREIVDNMYSDFDWYSGKFSKADKKWFLKYFQYLKAEIEGK